VVQANQILKEVISMVKVKQLKSNSGRNVDNQFIITDTVNNSETFQSYEAIIAIRYKSEEVGEKDFILIDRTYWDYSRTTGKYRNQFLGEGIAETRKKIENGVYRLVDLNRVYN
jgi:hypothetical protein